MKLALCILSRNRSIILYYVENLLHAYNNNNDDDEKL
jgi:hypothetical protein